jgi:SRSO17 transposase
VAERRRTVGIPDDVVFATKPKIGVAMVAAAIEAGVPCTWVLGDAVYGSDKTLRVMLENHDKPYVLSIRGNERLMIGDSARIRRKNWPRMDRKGRGFTIGRGFVRFATIAAMGPLAADPALDRGSDGHGVLMTFGPHVIELPELTAVAGLRWTIEECFQSAEGETGLDHCEARSWHVWHRHMTLSMLALAFLAGLRARLTEAQISAASGKANKTSLSAAA